MKKYFLVTLSLILLVSCCGVQPQKFDSEKWKNGDKSVRGSMVEDIKKSKILHGKTKPQIETLLGKADDNQENWLGYEVATISRCYFWQCRMEITFDPQTKKTLGDIAVSD